MFFRRFFFTILFGLLLIIGFAGMRHQSGYAQGYEQGYADAAQAFTAESAAEMAGQSEGQTAEQTAPTAPAAIYRPGGSGGLFGVFGFLFKLFLIFAAFAFFMKLFIPGRRRRWRGCRSGFRGHRRHWGKWDHHHGGPHQREKQPQKGEEGYEKQPEDVEPDVRSY